MTYNKKVILDMLENAPIEAGSDFYEERNDEFMEAMGEDFCNNFYYANGASKFVLIPKDHDTDFVIKIPYNGSLHGDSFWEDFCGANDESENSWTGWDYCLIEEHRFLKAQEEGLEECFAKVEFVGFIHGYPIYIQEKCVTLDEDMNRSFHSYEEKVKTSEICGNFHNINSSWLTDFRLYYGEEKLINFVNFIKENEWDDDLRTENIGYIGDRPVLIDYSGFWE